MRWKSTASFAWTYGLCWLAHAQLFASAPNPKYSQPESGQEWFVPDNLVANDSHSLILPPEMVPDLVSVSGSINVTNMTLRGEPDADGCSFLSAFTELDDKLDLRQTRLIQELQFESIWDSFPVAMCIKVQNKYPSKCIQPIGVLEFSLVVKREASNSGESSYLRQESFVDIMQSPVVFSVDNSAVSRPTIRCASVTVCSILQAFSAKRWTVWKYNSFQLLLVPYVMSGYDREALDVEVYLKESLLRWQASEKMVDWFVVANNTLAAQTISESFNVGATSVILDVVATSILESGGTLRCSSNFVHLGSMEHARSVSNYIFQTASDLLPRCSKAPPPDLYPRPRPTLPVREPHTWPIPTYRPETAITPLEENIASARPRGSPLGIICESGPANGISFVNAKSAQVAMDNTKFVFEVVEVSGVASWSTKSVVFGFCNNLLYFFVVLASTF